MHEQTTPLSTNEVIDQINNLTDLYDDSLKDRATQWLTRYSDAIVYKVMKTGDGCICFNYELEGTKQLYVVFETNHIIIWNLVGTVRKNYRRVKYLT